MKEAQLGTVMHPFPVLFGGKDQNLGLQGTAFTAYACDERALEHITSVAMSTAFASAKGAKQLFRQHRARTDWIATHRRCILDMLRAAWEGNVIAKRACLALAHCAIPIGVQGVARVSA